MAYIWNNNMNSAPLWGRKRPADANNFSTLNVSTITADKIITKELDANSISTFNISTYNLSAYNNYLDYIKNINIITNLVTLDNQALTATTGGLYLNGELIGTPSTVSSIADWSKFKAQTDVDMAKSTIKNALGISSIYLSTSLINCDSIKAIGARIDTLFGFDQIYYPLAKVEQIENSNLGTSSITASTILSELIYNESEISTYSVYADLGVIKTINNAEDFLGNRLKANRGTFTDNVFAQNSVTTNGLSTVNISTNFMEANETYAKGAVISTLVVQYLGSIDTLVVNKNSLLSTLRANNISTLNVSSQRVYADVGTFSTINARNINSLIGTFSTININNISTGNIIVSSINSSNGVFDNLYANNIYNTSNINTTNLNATSNTTLQNLTANGPITLNNELAMNGNVTFPTNNVISPEYPGGLAQFQKDIYNVRFVNAECINILGGSTGNEFFPPYRNDSIINVGEDLISPGQVIINGFNPDPLDTGIALTVRGDAQVEQNLNVLGEFNTTGLATFEGDVNVIGAITAEGGVSVTGDVDINGGLEVVGLTNMLGDANVGGVFVVGGETNLAGAVTCEAGIGIAGAMGVTGGNIVFGSGIDTGQTFTTYYTATFNNNIDALGVDINIADGRILGDSNSYLRIGNLSTINLQASNIASSNFTSSNVYANSVYTDNLYSKSASGISVYDTLDMNGYSISNVETLDVNFIKSEIYGYVSFENDLDMCNFNINNVNTIFLCNIDCPVSNYIISYKSFNFNSNDIINVNNFKANAISTNMLQAQDIIISDGVNNLLRINDASQNYLLGLVGSVYESPDVLFMASVSSMYLLANTNTQIQASNILSLVTSNNLNLTSSNVGIDCSNLIITGNTYVDFIQALYDPFIKINSGIDLSGNAILNGSFIYTSTLACAPTNGEVNGLFNNFIGAGVAFLGKPGDSNFWQLSKPDYDLSGTVAPNLPGSEGIYIIKRSGDDGNQLDKGRLYDDKIYTPWANCTGNLDMSANSISNVTNIYINNSNIYQGIVQPVILCGSDNTGSSGVTVTLPVAYPTSNYCIQLTYHNNPSGNKPLYHDSITTTDFFVDGDPNADFDWTTFYVP